MMGSFLEWQTKPLVESAVGGVCAFAMLGGIQTQRLVRLVHAYIATEKRTDDGSDHKVEYEDDDDRQKDTEHLTYQKRRVARVEQTAVAGPAQLGHAENAGEHTAEQAADTVAAERVERIVVAEVDLELGNRE